MVLEAAFNAIWDTMYSDIGKVISDYKPIGKEKNDNDKIENGEAIEEILQLVRKQNVLLSSPEQLLPPAYYVELQQKYSRNDGDIMYEQILMYTDRLLTNRYHFRETSEKNHDNEFSTDYIISLAAKTTCKDRWRQVLNEADRLRDNPKYLCTLQQGISEAHMDEMQ